MSSLVPDRVGTRGGEGEAEANQAEHLHPVRSRALRRLWLFFCMPPNSRMIIATTCFVSMHVLAAHFIDGLTLPRDTS